MSKAWFLPYHKGENKGDSPGLNEDIKMRRQDQASTIIIMEVTLSLKKFHLRSNFFNLIFVLLLSDFSYKLYIAFKINSFCPSKKNGYSNIRVYKIGMMMLTIIKGILFARSILCIITCKGTYDMVVKNDILDKNFVK